MIQISDSIQDNNVRNYTDAITAILVPRWR